MANRSEKPRKAPRWESLKSLDVVLPEVDSTSTELVIAPSEVIPPEPVSMDYPLLRILLRDKGYPFRTKYRPLEAAALLDTTDRTLRNWTSKKLVPFHCEPGGTPYFSPQDIEDILAASACNGKEVR